ALFDRSGMHGVILPDNLAQARLPKEGNGGSKFNLEDRSYRLAIANKSEHLDVLAAYSYGTRGNYFSGKNNSD
ncbi:hypothetical protein JVW21_21125, partial [Vibrio cholerae O1]|uniref:hypothetical protein n=1 Tax=Vibrio cholerae TaxID=666 RepID=UPI001C122663